MVHKIKFSEGVETLELGVAMFDFANFFQERTQKRKEEEGKKKQTRWGRLCVGIGFRCLFLIIQRVVRKTFLGMI